MKGHDDEHMLEFIPVISAVALLFFCISPYGLSPGRGGVIPQVFCDWYAEYFSVVPLYENNGFFLAILFLAGILLFTLWFRYRLTLKHDIRQSSPTMYNAMSVLSLLISCLGILFCIAGYFSQDRGIMSVYAGTWFIIIALFSVSSARYGPLRDEQ